MYNQKSKDTGFVFNTKKVKQNIKFNLKDGIHSIIIGSTGSGKTQTIVFPTIYVNAKSTTKPSMIITDLKGEIFETQSQLLKKLGYTIKVLNFRDLTIGNT
jgi:type IV secretion system protein VirD4